jgi:hypothetical protein
VQEAFATLGANIGAAMLNLEQRAASFASN